MKRYLDWFLKTLVVAAVVGALFRRSEPQPASSPGAVLGPGASGFVASPGAVPGAENGFVGPAKSIGKAISQRFKEHTTVLIAASLAYYGIFALFPTLIATVSIFGLVADPAVLNRQVQEITEAVPGTTGQFIADQLNNLTQVNPSGLGIASVVSVITALWAASAGTKALIQAISIAYDARHEGGYLVQRAVALAVTLGLIVTGVVLAAAVAFLPQILGWVGLADETVTLINIARWPAIFFVVVLGIGALYKFAPDRPARKTPWISVGAGTAAVIWLLATVGLAVYVDNFSSMPETYGALTGVVVTMLWFFVSGLVILAGAELNAELEARQAYAVGAHRRLGSS